MNEVSNMPRAMKKREFFCCSCGNKLIPYPKTRILKRGDPDYKGHSRLGRMHLIGDIELTKYDFKCISCDKLITYEEQCVIEEIQKCVGSHTLSQNIINENIEKAKATLERKKKTRNILNKTIGAIATILVIYYCLKTGDFSFRF